MVVGRELNFAVDIQGLTLGQLFLAQSAVQKRAKSRRALTSAQPLYVPTIEHEHVLICCTVGLILCFDYMRNSSSSAELSGSEDK